MWEGLREVGKVGIMLGLQIEGSSRVHSAGEYVAEEENHTNCCQKVAVLVNEP